MDAFERSVIIAAVLIILSVIASKASSRSGIPALLLFLAIGIGAGSHGLAEVHFTNYPLARALGVFALTFILFSGGMSTDLKVVRPLLKPALVLSTLGVVIASALVSIFAHTFLAFSWIEGLLLGATVASTDVAAVFTVLRSRKVSLKEGIAPLLELESALNDPMAVFLGVALLELLGTKERSIMSLIPLFFQQMIVGSLMGWGSGKLATIFINRIKLEFEGLYPVLSVALVLVTYAITQSFGGSGFLAVYVAGIIFGNENLLHKRSLIHFHEGIAWLGQIGMFLTMGLLVDPTELWKIAPWGIALSVFLVFVARPGSVFLSFLVSRFNSREKVMISWAGLRGAVPIILASYILATHIQKSTLIFNYVFFVTCFSVLLQGTTIPILALWLRVDSPVRERFRFPIEFNPSQDMTSKLLEVFVPVGSRTIGKSLIELSLPKDVLVILIQRQGDILVPRGGTQITALDTLLVLSESKSREEIKGLLV